MFKVSEIIALLTQSNGLIRYNSLENVASFTASIRLQVKMTLTGSILCVKLATIHLEHDGGIKGWLLALLSCVMVKAATMP